MAAERHQSAPRYTGVLAGDPILLARAPRTRPRWSQPIGGGFQEVLIVPDGSNDLLLADAGGIQRISIDGDLRWNTPPFGAHGLSGIFDLDRDGRLEIVTSNGRELILLSAVDGAILFRFDVGPPFSYGTYAGMIQVHSFWGRGMQILVPCFSHKEVLMFDCSAGAEHTRLMHRLWMNDGYHPSIAIGDVTGNGLDEIVIARLGGVYVFDPESGRMISETLWKSDAERRRNYGLVTLQDIDESGRLSAIILSDKVTRHIAVLAGDGKGNFEMVWDRFIEHIYPEDTKELRFTAEPIARFGKDGPKRLTVSIFNDRADNRWYTEMLDPVTGILIDELPDQYLRGIQDINGDGVKELCLSQELERSAGYLSTISAYSPGERTTLWSKVGSRFAERTLRTIGAAALFKPNVFDEHEIWTLRQGTTPVITEHADGYQLAMLDSSLRLSTPILTSNERIRISERIADNWIVSKEDGTLFQLNEELRALRKCGYHLTPEAHLAARPGPTSLVFQTRTGERFLAITEFTDHISVYRDGSRQPERTARIRGRGRLGYDNVFHSPSAIETRGEQYLAIVDDHGLSHARLSLYTTAGELHRSYDFPDMPASESGSRLGCYDWLKIRHSRGEALFVSFYQSHSMNSECSRAILIDSGEELWRMERTGTGEHGRGVGPWGTSALAEVNGSPVAIFCAKDTLCEVDLEQGTFRHEPMLLTSFTADAMRAKGIYKEQGLATYSSIDDPFTAYGTPIVLGDMLFIAGCFGGYGLLDKNRKAVWWHIASFGDVLYRLPAFGDFDGDGRTEIAMGHADGVLRVYDLLTGAVRAELNLATITTDALSADVNGDGKPEIVCGTSDGRLLVVTMEGGECRILEERQCAGGLGSPTVADLDGDGIAEIYVADATGSLHLY